MSKTGRVATRDSSNTQWALRVLHRSIMSKETAEPDWVFELRHIARRPDWSPGALSQKKQPSADWVYELSHIARRGLLCNAAWPGLGLEKEGAQVSNLRSGKPKCGCCSHVCNSTVLECCRFAPGGVCQGDSEKHNIPRHSDTFGLGSRTGNERKRWGDVATQMQDIRSTDLSTRIVVCYSWSRLGKTLRVL